MTQRDYQAIRTWEELRQLREQLLEKQYVSFDVETGYSTAKPVEKRALDIYHPDFFVVGFSVTTDPSWARYIPLRHDNDRPFPDPQEVWEFMRPVFEGGHRVTLAHHAKFEEKILRSVGIHPTRMADSMLLSHVTGRNKYHGLKHLSQTVLGVDQAEFGTLFEAEITAQGKKFTAAAVKRARFNTLDVTQDVVNYACDDVTLCMELFTTMWSWLSPERQRLYNVEMAISRLMCQAEEFGIGVDWRGITEAHGQYKTFVENFEQFTREGFAAMSVDPEVKTLAREANFGSTLQMRKLLYARLGMTTTRTTNKGELSTDAQALETLSRKHSAVRTLLSLREVHNLGRRLNKWLLESSESVDARMHATFSQTQVVSGRFSAADQPVQQLPKQWFWTTKYSETGEPLEEGDQGHDYWSGNFREFITADVGKSLISFDYSQIELRVLAGITQEPTLLRAFENGDDPHIATAAMMLGKPIDGVTKEDRAKGKTLNFGILYGLGIKSLAERLAITKDEAEDLMNKYKSQFSQVASWESNARAYGMAPKYDADGERQHYVTTWFGRRVPLWSAFEEDPWKASNAERLAVNAQIQGGAADYVKLAMLRSHKALEAAGLWHPDKVMLTMNQHDALTFEVDNSLDMNMVRDILREAVIFRVQDMVPDCQIQFPEFEVDWEVGDTWGGSYEWPDDVRAVYSEEVGYWHPETVTEPAPRAMTESPSPLTAPQSDEQPVPDLSITPKPPTPQNAAPATSQTVLIAAPPSCTEAGLTRLVDLVTEHPGPHPVVLDFDNKRVRLAKTTSLTVEQAGKFSLALRGATVSMIEGE